MEKNYDNLYKKYEHLFTKNERRAVAMFGFECGDGWYKILEQLIDHIDSYIKHKYKDKEFDFQIAQIKEKFGGLRFYFDGGDDVIHELVRYTENLSYHTCEYCGSNQNVMRSQGWIITACKPCTLTHENLNRPDRKWVTVID
jgi:hypothetical protein